MPPTRSRCARCRSSVEVRDGAVEESRALGRRRRRTARAGRPAPGGGVDQRHQARRGAARRARDRDGAGGAGGSLCRSRRRRAAGARRPPDLDLVDPELPSVAVLEERAQAAEAAALAVKGVTKSEGASASAGIGGMVLVTSHGFRGAYLSSRHGVSHDRDRRRGHRHGARLRLHLDAARRRPRRAGADRAHGRRARGRAAQSAQGRDQAGAGGVRPAHRRRRSSVIWPAPSTAASVARKTSFLRDKLGERLFRPGIRIVDDPLRQRGLRSRPFDGEGVAARPLAIVDDGVLTTWILDCATARELDLDDHRPRPARRVVAAVARPDQPASRGRHAHARRADRRHRGRLLRHRADRHRASTWSPATTAAAPPGFWIENGQPHLSGERGDHRGQSRGDVRARSSRPTTSSSATAPMRRPCAWRG